MWYSFKLGNDPTAEPDIQECGKNAKNASAFQKYRMDSKMANKYDGKTFTA